LIFPNLRRTILCGFILSALLSAGGPPLAAQAPISREYQLKAAFLFHFTQFVKWPSAAFTHEDQPFRIGVLGEDPFDGFLDDTVKGEKVDGHPLVIERFNSIEEVKGCQILFISRSEGSQMEKILGDLKSRNILTVGDAEGFIKNGGMIRFSTEGNKIHLRISLEAAKSGNLDISSKMLRLADIVPPGKD
jgi:hypothetical protein